VPEGRETIAMSILPRICPTPSNADAHCLRKFKDRKENENRKKGIPQDSYFLHEHGLKHIARSSRVLGSSGHSMTHSSSSVESKNSHTYSVVQVLFNPTIHSHGLRHLPVSSYSQLSTVILCQRTSYTTTGDQSHAGENRVGSVAGSSVL